MNAVIEMRPNHVPALAMSEDELIDVLQVSLYPGAALRSIKMVIQYCKAANLDPMQKPVHIVPMWDSKTREMRDVIMPGIGLYRTQASRTGQFAGMAEPEFGQMITETIEGVTITYPEFARVTVKRALPSGIIAEFTAIEYWLENYAVKGGKEKSIAPNSMWAKRPRGQIAKCASAQAMRIAFPELGAQPTADEMEGKTMYSEIDITPQKPSEPEAPRLAAYQQENFDKNFAAWEKIVKAGTKTPQDIIDTISTKSTLSEDQVKKIRAIKADVQEALAAESEINAMRVQAEDIAVPESEICDRLGVQSLDNLTVSQLDAAINYLKGDL